MNQTIEERVGRDLVRGGFLTQERLKEAQAKADATGKRLTEVLLADQLITPEALTIFMGFRPAVELWQSRIQWMAVALVPEEVARKLGVLPLALNGDVLWVAIEDPKDMVLVIDTLTKKTMKLIRPVLLLQGGLAEAIDAAYTRYTRAKEE